MRSCSPRVAGNGYRCVVIGFPPTQALSYFSYPSLLDGTLCSVLRGGKGWAGQPSWMSLLGDLSCY